MIKRKKFELLIHVKDNLDAILLLSVAMDGGALDRLGFEVIWSEAV